MQGLNPKISIWLSFDPLAESIPNFNPYNYVMQNPLNFTDPTGMAPEGSGGGGSKLRAFFNKLLYGKDESLLPDGRLDRLYSRATGWRIQKGKSSEVAATNENVASVEEKIKSIFELLDIKEIKNSLDITPGELNIITDISTKDIKKNDDGDGNKIVIDNKIIAIAAGEKNDVTFNFANIGNPGVSIIDGSTTGTFQLQNLNGNQKTNLKSIANTLASNTKLSITFNFPSHIGISRFASYNNAILSMYQKSYNQIRGHLMKQGVSSSQIRMSQGKGFNVIVR